MTTSEQKGSLAVPSRKEISYIPFIPRKFNNLYMFTLHFTPMSSIWFYKWIIMKFGIMWCYSLLIIYGSCHAEVKPIYKWWSFNLQELSFIWHVRMIHLQMRDQVLPCAISKLHRCYEDFRQNLCLHTKGLEKKKGKTYFAIATIHNKTVLTSK